MNPRIMVIGCGIIGGAALDSLTANNANKDYEICVLDIFPKSMDIKTMRDLDGTPAVWIPRTRISGFPGGNLNWGRNSSLVIFDDPDTWDSNFIEQIQSISENLVQLGFPRLKLKRLSPENIEDSFVVRENRKVNTSDLRKALNSHNALEIINGYALKIRRLGSERFQVEFKDPEGTRNFTEVDFILICAGPIGTQELLANSEIIGETPSYILDHPSFKLGTICYDKVILARKGLFGWNRFDRLNDKFCFTFFDSEKQYLWTMRLFPRGVIGLSKIFRLLPKRLKANQYGTFTRELFHGIVSLISGRILISGIDLELTLDFLNREDGLMAASYSNSTRIEYLGYPFEKIDIPDGIYTYANKILTKYKFGPPERIRFAKGNEIPVGEITSSSHHMSTVMRPLDMRLDFTEVSQNIHAAGASIFPRTVPGHPTFLGAVTALYAVEKILHKVKTSLI